MATAIFWECTASWLAVQQCRASFNTLHIIQPPCILLHFFFLPTIEFTETGIQANLNYSQPTKLSNPTNTEAAYGFVWKLFAIYRRFIM